MFLRLCIICTIISINMCAMEETNQLDDHNEQPNSTQRAIRLLWQCCMPKVVKLGVTTCICGKSCIEGLHTTLVSSSEYRCAQWCIPVIQNPYCWVAVSAGGLVGLGYASYRYGLCPQCSNKDISNKEDSMQNMTMN